MELIESKGPHPNIMNLKDWYFNKEEKIGGDYYGPL